VNGNAHVDAVLDLLRTAAAATSVAVHDGQSPNLAATPYLVVYADPGVGSHLAMDGVSGHLDQVIQITAVGGSRWQAGMAADLARDALLDVVPTVAGRRCWPIRQEFAQPARIDVDDPDLFIAVAGYRVRSDPAPA
jgi:hypothetical protein